MCKCNPNLRNPYCGKLGCEPHNRKHKVMKDFEDEQSEKLKEEFVRLAKKHLTDLINEGVLGGDEDMGFRDLSVLTDGSVVHIQATITPVPRCDFEIKKEFIENNLRKMLKKFEGKIFNDTVVGDIESDLYEALNDYLLIDFLGNIKLSDENREKLVSILGYEEE